MENVKITQGVAGLKRGDLTPTMLEAIEYAKNNGGVIVRHQGGFWASENATYNEMRYSGFGAATINALVQRGKAEFTEWKEGRTGKFPIKMQLKEGV